MSVYYGRVSYWDERFSKELQPFDWYARFGHFKRFVVQHLKRSDYILIVGCGSSRFTEELYNSEYTSVANIDYSSVVIKQQAERHQEKKRFAQCSVAAFVA